MISWKENINPAEWDFLIGTHNGHPLQSALWGDSKKNDHYFENRVAFYDNHTLIAMFRIEKKVIPFFGTIAWISQGPVFIENRQWINLKKTLNAYLKNKYYSASMIRQWEESEVENGNRQTVWIDLTVGIAQLEKPIWRQAKRLALIQNIEVIITQDCAYLSVFYRLCKIMSRQKRFRFQYSEAQLHFLMTHRYHPLVQAKLFIAKKGNQIAGGALILTSGSHLHYLCGTVNREFSKSMIGEYLQSTIIQWACDNQFLMYDLEGIDSYKNPGVAAFKKKMGGKIVSLKPPIIEPYTLRCRLLSVLMAKTNLLN